MIVTDRALSFSPDSKRLLADYSNGTGDIWNIAIEEPAIDADLMNM